jgi:twitching motility protein PilT
MTTNFRPDPKLDALIRRLNDAARRSDADEPPADERPSESKPAVPETEARSDWTLPTGDPGGRDRLHALLARCREIHSTDLTLVAGAPPMARVDGDLTPLETERLSDANTAAMCAALVPKERRAAVSTSGAVDFSLTLVGLGRFRCNVHRERARWSAAVRLFPRELPEIEELHLPAGLATFAEMHHGLVLVTGPTGSGKSTTLAAILKRALVRRRAHVITIEDPVEYEHPHGGSVVEHIEIGRDAPTFVKALRAALRQDPDILLVGEMRDRESISIAITAAETGHLVLSTLHTGDAPQTINRILDSYPAGQTEAVRTQLSVSLAGIVSQRLLPRKDDAGRVPAVELVFASDAIRNLVRRGKIEQIRTQVSLEQGAGMITLDQSLADLVRRGLVDLDVARKHARAPNELESLLGRNLSGGAQRSTGVK